MPRLHRRLLTVVAVLALFVAGCGDDDPADTTATTAPEADTTTTAGEEPEGMEEGVTGDDGDAATELGQADVTIDIVSISEAFDPATERVTAGTEVTWVNEDDLNHTATAEDGTWDSGNLAPGDEFSFTPEEPGTYSYICTIHPSMTGELIVE